MEYNYVCSLCGKGSQDELFVEDYIIPGVPNTYQTTQEDEDDPNDPYYKKGDYYPCDVTLCRKCVNKLGQHIAKIVDVHVVEDSFDIEGSWKK